MSRRDFVLTGAAAGAWVALPAFAQSSAPSSGRPGDLATMTLKQASLVRRRDAAPVELTQACLAVLALAHAYERATSWHMRRPPLS